MAENSKISPDSSSNLGFDARLWLAIMNLALRGIEANFGPETSSANLSGIDGNLDPEKARKTLNS